jgi:hypothetical protein
MDALKQLIVLQLFPFFLATYTSDKQPGSTEEFLF